jgi:hypothetical protein
MQTRLSVWLLASEPLNRSEIHGFPSDEQEQIASKPPSSAFNARKAPLLADRPGPSWMGRRSMGKNVTLRCAWRSESQSASIHRRVGELDEQNHMRGAAQTKRKTQLSPPLLMSPRYLSFIKRQTCPLLTSALGRALDVHLRHTLRFVGKPPLCPCACSSAAGQPERDKELVLRAALAACSTKTPGIRSR